MRPSHVLGHPSADWDSCWHLGFGAPPVPRLEKCIEVCMRCPNCSTELEMTDRQGIEVFCCPHCAGIWLNAGILETIVRRTLDANAEFATDSSPAAKTVLDGSRRAFSFPTQTKWRSLKMKIMAVCLLAALGLFAAIAYGDEPKRYRIDLASAKIGTVEIAGGEYTMLVHRDGAEPTVRFTDVRKGNEINVAAKVESGDQKFERTEVHSQDANGVKQITEIRLGGTKIRIDFRQGS